MELFYSMDILKALTIWDLVAQETYSLFKVRHLDLSRAENSLYKSHHFLIMLHYVDTILKCFCKKLPLRRTLEEKYCMSLADYHKNITLELLATNNNVRSLINHWGEEGRYKEEVLKNMIRRFLPEKYKIASGFVIRPVQDYGQHEASRQIDLLIYDNESPLVFKEGDFVITTPDSVRAIIEVKANMQNQNTRAVVEEANDKGKFIFEGKTNKDASFFNGIFSYASTNPTPNRFHNSISQANERFEADEYFKKFKVNHISFDKDWFIKYWVEEDRPHSIYQIPDLSFSFFISNLVDTLANKSVEANNFIWFALDKEHRKILDF